MDRLKSLFCSFAGRMPDAVQVLSAEGSPRRYVRLSAAGHSFMGVIGTSVEENAAFIAMSRHFKERGLPVPAVLAVSEDGLLYLQEDLGDRTLFNVLAPARASGVYGEEEVELLVRTIRRLPSVQIRGAEGFDFGKCYSEPRFGARQILFDLNYFKYNFLKFTGLHFNESRLQDDFEQLCSDLCAVGGIGFLYRDFQSRNVMLVGDEPYFIDFQGGQQGPHQYDLASFVWQAKAAYPAELRERLVGEYIDALREFGPVDEKRFRQDLRIFVLFRTLQVLGAYGYRGLYEGKPHFIGSIPFAMANLRDLLSRPFAAYPYLTEVLTELSFHWDETYGPAVLGKQGGPARSGKPADTAVSGRKLVERKPGAAPLEVQVSSFSYKVGIPEDDSSNGGGYVFDCRYMHNPGRYDEYKQLTGMDRPVIDFLEKDGEILHYLEHVYALVDPHVETFLRRGFTHLQVSFGCTGGQHRSVYCAESLARHLHEKYGVRVHLRHLAQGVDKILEGGE